MEANEIIGYVASSTTMVAFGLQFIHTVRCGTIEGLSPSRTVLDTLSLSFWVVYATRTEDFPLLIATSCELFLSVCVCALILKHAFCGPCETPVVTGFDLNKPVITGFDLNKPVITGFDLNKPVVTGFDLTQSAHPPQSVSVSIQEPCSLP